ncbi:hypothetical protein A6768_04975 [Sphingobium yanoikuyae]|uniref:Uncharacterized protein n=1 Tax=Sphingobium yanoikuyae TaxID=13690 RepID=A0A291MWZ2_SPHYA|nr:hypothetical protein A6768_04975 [Sphingobium yanoikuyae]
MICGGRLNSFTASKRCDRRLIERERPARCKTSWQPSSKNGSGFVLRRTLGNQNEQAAEHIAQGDFTRQDNGQGYADEGRPLRFDLAGFGFGFFATQPSQLHDLRWINLMLRKDSRHTAGEI